MKFRADFSVYRLRSKVEVWTTCNENDATGDIDELLTWITNVHAKRGEIEYTWGIWLGTLESVQQITLAVKRTHGTSGDKIGKRIAKGSWDEIWPLFEAYARML